MNFSPDGFMPAGGGAGSMIYLWGILPEWVTSVAEAPGVLASGNVLPQLRGTLRGHTAAVQQVAFRPMTATVTADWELASDDMTIRLWDVVARTTMCTLHGHHDFVTSLALSPIDACWPAAG